MYIYNWAPRLHYDHLQAMPWHSAVQIKHIYNTSHMIRHHYASWKDLNITKQIRDNWIILIRKCSYMITYILCSVHCIYLIDIIMSLVRNISCTIYQNDTPHTHKTFPVPGGASEAKRKQTSAAPSAVRPGVMTLGKHKQSSLTAFFASQARISIGNFRHTQVYCWVLCDGHVPCMQYPKSGVQTHTQCFGASVSTCQPWICQREICHHSAPRDTRSSHERYLNRHKTMELESRALDTNKVFQAHTQENLAAKMGEIVTAWGQKFQLQLLTMHQMLWMHAKFKNTNISGVLLTLNLAVNRCLGVPDIKSNS